MMIVSDVGCENTVNKKNKYYIVFVWVLVLIRTFVSVQAQASVPAPISGPKSGPNFDFQEFGNSFLQHYEFSPEGRYVHEYHPFLLHKTAHSFDELEATLNKEGLNLLGRIIVSGYEEHAVPSYYTNYKAPRINDEASVKGLGGLVA